MKTRTHKDFLTTIVRIDAKPKFCYKFVQFMKKNPKDFFVLILFYLNLVIYVGGDAYWRFVKPTPVSTRVEAESINYDNLIEKYAQRNGLDWRFVSSMIDAESSFRPDAVSSAGAVGLMQVSQAVATSEGVSNIEDPEQNIRIGVKHFKRYFKILRGATLEDTLKINLAAYNAGIAHVQDAQKLALYLNLNPRLWTSLEKTLPLLEDEAFQPFINYGYCQGNSVVGYVRKVFHKYQQYRTNSPDFPLETKVL